MKGKINNLQINEDVKLELLNLLNSSFDEESEFDLEQVYQH